MNPLVQPCISFKRLFTIGNVVGLALLLATALRAFSQETPKFAFLSRPGSVQINVGPHALATYVYEDKDIPRPYFAHVRAPGNIQVTRTYPPIAGKDPTDHGTFHPGIWMAFGDLSKADSWRLKAKVRHIEFIDPPKNGSNHFAVKNHYLAADGKTIVCTETCRFTFHVRPAGYLLLWDSQFHSGNADFAFGDQEEMGLGVRLATPLIVKNGGEIRTSAGDVNEKNVRGKAAEWCDYSGTIDGQRVGVTLMPDPKNFRQSWYHARDYGLLVANPFGRNALTRGEVSRVTVQKGESMRLRFGVFLHGMKEVDLNAAYRDYLKVQQK